MKKALIILIILAGLGYAGYHVYLKDKAEVAEGAPRYQFAKIERKNILNMITTTGSLTARELVEVGSQVSGTIEEVYKDFNDTVKAGELVALIDTATLDAQVKSAEADVMRQKASLKRATIQYERFKPVYEKGFLSGDDFLNYEIGKETAEANLHSAEASLDRAKRNREYAEIRAPISGVIIDRNVERGQTVAASFNTPRLFIIAEDLSLMEILANVDESDIGQIQDGQEVRFTVASYPERNFTGTVTEIRLQPQVIQNVVNYTVVVETENPGRVLLPGMTATLDFVVDEVEDALSVPASALNLKMSDEMLEIMQKRREEMMARREQILAQRQGAVTGEAGQRRPRGENGDSVQRRPRPEGIAGFNGGESPRGGASGGNRRSIATLWHKDENGALKMMAVRTGVTDGITTEVLPLREEEIPEGLEIISKVLTPSINEDAGNQRGFGGRGPGGRGSFGRFF